MKAKNKTLKQLTSEWYDKLKNEGFEDIEDQNYNLKQMVSGRFLRGKNNGLSLTDTLFKNNAKQDYYRLAGYFLHDYIFNSELDKVIWELHAEGTSHRDISIRLKNEGINKARTQVLDIINKLQKELYKHYRVSK